MIYYKKNNIFHVFNYFFQFDTHDVFIYVFDLGYFIKNKRTL
jgi:hypothetical protein